MEGTDLCQASSRGGERQINWSCLLQGDLSHKFYVPGRRSLCGLVLRAQGAFDLSRGGQTRAGLFLNNEGLFLNKTKPSSLFHLVTAQPEYINPGVLHSLGLSSLCWQGQGAGARCWTLPACHLEGVRKSAWGCGSHPLCVSLQGLGAGSGGVGSWLLAFGGF